MAASTADPYDVVRRMRWATNRVAVGFSCGKDATATLDVCARWFDEVLPFYCYVVPGLSFHEQYLAWWERRLAGKIPGGRIPRVPHWGLANDLRISYHRPPGLKSSFGLPRTSIGEIEAWVWKHHGFDWFAYGMKKHDSLERRAMLSQSSGIILGSRRGFPIAEWSNRSVTQYLINNKIPLSPEYKHLGSSFTEAVDGESLKMLRDHYPADFRRVLRRYPYAVAELARYEMGLSGIAGNQRVQA